MAFLRLHGFALALTVLVSSNVVADIPEMREKLASVSKDVKTLLASRNEDSIAIGHFTGPASFPATSGPGIAQTLAEEVEKLKIVVKPRAKLGIRGQYTFIQQNTDPFEFEHDNENGILVKGTIEDISGKVFLAFDFKLRGELAVAEMLGLTVRLHYDKRNENVPRNRVAKIREALNEPRFSKEGNSIVKAAEGSPYAMEVVVGGKGCTLKNEDGLAFVEVGKGERFVVKLHNFSKQDAVVRLHIDGISVFRFSEQRDPLTKEPLYDVFFVKANSQVEVRGWYINKEKSDEFLVVSHAKRGGVGFDHKIDVGTVTASFAAAWPRDEVPPPDEPPQPRAIRFARTFGKRTNAPFVEVQPSVGAVRASISVRYAK